MKFRSLFVSSAMAAFAILPTHAFAAAITTLYNTGVNAAGATLANGTTDSHYKLVGTAATAYGSAVRAGTTANGYPVTVYVGDDSLSDWIGPQTDATFDGYAGNFDYQTTFSLAGFNAATAKIVGQFAADNSLVNILVNGVSTGISGVGYGAFTAFSLNSGFVAGTNTLDFIVNNSQSGPTAFRVEATGTASAVPEASTWAMMVAGFAFVGFAMRRRTTANRVTYA